MLFKWLHVVFGIQELKRASVLQTMPRVEK